jgi:hypothetical protein
VARGLSLKINFDDVRRGILALDLGGCVDPGEWHRSPARDRSALALSAFNFSSTLVWFWPARADHGRAVLAISRCAPLSLAR